jgi:hypothetical protein
VAGSCEYGNEPSGSIKCREFLDCQSTGTVFCGIRPTYQNSLLSLIQHVHTNDFSVRTKTCVPDIRYSVTACS